MTVILLRSAVSAVLALGVSGAIQADTRPARRSPQSVILEFHADRVEYRLDDTAHFDVRLFNHSESAIGLFGILRWGLRAGLTLWITDPRTGKIVGPRHLDDSAISAIEAADSKNYVWLSAHHYLGTSREDKVRDLVHAAGEYLAFIEYRSPASRAHNSQMKFISTEDGAIQSNSLRIVVKD